MKKNVDEKLDIYKITTSKELLKYYQDWTKKNKYNQDMVDLNYVAPKEAVSLLKKYALNRESKILDAGCGTGLVGIELKKCGYSNIEGVDFSQDMLDLILCVGTFTYGHVKPQALDELIRITKNKGLICFTINEGIYEEYGFDNKIKELSNNKLWNVKEFFKSDYIVNKDVNAWLCLSKITK